MVMSFLKRLAVVAVTIAAISVLAALAWDGSDTAAANAATLGAQPDAPPAH